ncbi:ATP-binding protein [Kutzneria sp. 744]|uniref:AAA family ATPase n=1 Tax=Kutzneria sp. (strain 744) TaxID=345341 RepID=UPI0003EEA5A9|nr:ATP-binding protein [Kutzneria sp. 744]EWM13759.1 LigA protein [Kutzneria sp. 744]
MSSLQPAHRGYEYQDLLAASRLVDLVLGTVIAAQVDKKQVEDDRFDDLTVVTAGGRRERTQFKHTDNDDKPLTVDTFTNDKRDLRLDRLVAAAVADRDGPGSDAIELAFRVVLRDTWPVDEALTDVLVPANLDPGPFVAGMQTRRFRFDVDRLWPLATHRPATGSKSKRSRFDFLRSGKKAVDRADLAWLCHHLVIEVEAPKSTGFMLDPGPAELILLTRVRTEVGAESYPNANRSAADVADAFATFTRQARQGLSEPTAKALLARAQIRRDFGAVSRAHPVDHSVEVTRPTTVADVRVAAEHAALQGVPLVLTGPPGQGKSWACDQLVRELVSSGWLVAEHYCYLNDTLDERNERVRAETVFGSLLGRLAEADPSLVETQRPLYAANEESLANAVRSAVQARPDRRVALVVDGLDHVGRLREALPGTDPSAALAFALAGLDIPAGSVLIVLSQPGQHLAPLHQDSAHTVEIPGLTPEELSALAAKLGVVAGPDVTDAIVEEDQTDSFLATLGERSRGNALYATYLCREVHRHARTEADPEAVLSALPPFDGKLQNYYAHLISTLGEGSGVADIIGLLDFPASRTELAEMRPDLTHRLDDALATLAPVLVERAAQGGLRVYHESFARFLRRKLESNPAALAANLRFVVEWLEARGFYRDERAFRFLLTTLAAAGRDKEALNKVDASFVANAVAGGHPASAIAANLAVATGCAGRLRDLPALTRCVELARAAQNFEYEVLDTAIVEYIDVPMALLGQEEFASRLTFDGYTAVPARAGLQLCAAIDAAGAVAPWQDYLPAFAEWDANNDTDYGSESDKAVTLAWARGQLRQAVTEDQNTAPRHKDIASFLNESNLPPDDIIPVAADVLGIETTAALLDHLDSPPDAALVLAEVACRSADPSAVELLARLLPLAMREPAPGNAHRMIELGAAPQDIDRSSVGEARTALIALTREVTGHDALHVAQRVPMWLDRCVIAARRDPTILPTVEGMLGGAGWYLCWLRFVLALVQAESAEADRGQLAFAAVGLLAGDLEPFTGRPPACDLYPIRERITSSLRRAIALLDDDRWPAALRILRQVSEGVGVSMRGQDAGPITPDSLLTLAIAATTTQGRRAATQELIDAALTEGSGRRYYSTLAEYRLMAARFAIACGDMDRAESSWHEACCLMTAYGYHKDTTIYEVLDPLQTLVAADPSRARARLAQVQPTCERVARHTDGKETRAAKIQWWATLAEADPAGLTRLVIPTLLEQCGHVNDLYGGALEDVWRSWYQSADPVVAGALRLALPMTKDTADPAMAERLANITAGTGEDLAGQLLTLLLARADERPLSDPNTNSDESIAQHTAWVQALNLVAARVNAPQICVPLAAAVTPRRQPATASQTPVSPEQNAVGEFPNGIVGLNRAIRAWRRRPYDTSSPDWAPEKFATLIGDRLVQLAGAGAEEDAIAALHSLASTVDTLDRSRLLTLVGRGLEHHSHPRLAAVALSLAWTRTSSDGFWMNFGGQKELDSLRHATCLDADATWATVAAEVTQVVAGGHRGSRGVSQALIHAGLVDGLTPHAHGHDASFSAWDEAHSVISLRTPRMSPEDDPQVPYAPPAENTNNDLTDEIDGVFCEAVLGTMAHPGQENRRRALIAFELLLLHRPEAAIKALAAVLPALNEPALLSWLLAVITDIDAAHPMVAEQCRDALQQHAHGPYLTVRALASKLLGDNNTPPPSATPDAALLGTTLLLPAGKERFSEEAAQLVGMLAGRRLLAAEELLPNLGLAVVARVDAALSDTDEMKKIQSEAQELADTRHRRWTDAFTGRCRLVEEALQLAASGGRAALLASGRPPANPAAWEQALARVLVNRPTLPLAIECTREPRPHIIAPPGAKDPVWARAIEATGVQSRGAAEADLVMTVASTSLEQCDILTAGRYRRWRVIARTEETTVLPVWPERDDLLRQSGRDLALELRRPGDAIGLSSRPFSAESASSWFAAMPPLLNNITTDTTSPLIGINVDDEFMDDARDGLGVHDRLLVPSPALRLALGLQPAAEPFVLHNDIGPALAMITWRSHYEGDAYHLPWPRSRGTMLVVSPAAFERLLAWGTGNLITREVVHGDASLADGADG